MPVKLSFCVFLLFFPFIAKAQLSTVYNNSACGLNHVQASVHVTLRSGVFGQFGSGLPATVTISGLPASCFTIEKAYVWSVFSYKAGSPNPPLFTITPPVGPTSGFTGVLAGQAGSKCWGEIGTRTWRADVTSVISGNGAYTITVNTVDDWEVDGFTLFIIYRDNNATYEGHIIIDDGAITVSSSNTNINHTMTGFTACANSTYSDAFQIVADMQNNVSGTFTQILNGVNVAVPRDFYNYDQTTASTVSAGQTSAAFGVTNNKNDCYTLAVSGLYFQTTTCNACTPVGIIADFTFDTVCVGRITSFTDLSTPVPVSWDWDFGDATFSTIPDPSHLYLTAGIYPVQLTVTAANGCQATIVQDVIVGSIPAADFGYTKECLLNPAQFTDISNIVVGNAVAWDWDFGDTTFSILQDPSHLYDTFGLFNVTLIVTTNFGCTDTIQDSIEVAPPAVADFNANTVCSGNLTQFTDLSNFTTGWDWDFGDSFTDTVQNPAHLYDTSGTFIVQLISTTGLGCADTVVKNITVNPNPVPDFSFTSICNGDTTQFANASTISSGSINIYNWDFDDGSPFSSQTDPSHLFLNAGIYDVQLVLTSDNLCTDTIIKPVNVNPVPEPQIAFIFVCFGDSTPFFATDLGSGNVVSWNWDFGDGDTSILENPIHLFDTAGYLVQLIVTTDSGCTDTTQAIIGLFPQPFAEFDFTTECDGDSVRFTDQSIINPSGINGWIWDMLGFGDTTYYAIPDPVYLYDSAGTYTVQLIVTTINGCVDSIQKNITVFPEPTADFFADTVCFGLTTQFTDSSVISGDTIITWFWDFGDIGTDTVQNPLHLYAGPDTFIVQLIIESVNGCNDTIQKDVIVYPQPIADFAATTVSCGNATQFTDSLTISGDTITTWFWDFGEDTATSTLPDPSHTYDSSGTYNVLLIVSTAFCTDSVRQPVDVSSLIANFNAAPECLGDSTYFTNLSIGSIVDWSWDFGDTTTSTAQNPSHTYSSAGIFNVQLTVGLSGCAVTIVKQVTVIKLTAAFSDTAVCFGNTTLFTDLSFVNPVSWSWDFGDSSYDSIQNTSHIYDSAGTFIVQLIVVDTLGCIGSTINSVTVYPLPTANAISDTTIFVGDTIFLGGLPTGSLGTPFPVPPYYNYFWLPAINLDDLTLENPLASIPDTTRADSIIYIVTVTDVNGCTAIDTVIITLEQRCEIIPYKGISPNDDKVNDTWIIDGIESCPLNTVTIFNRWGDLIWEGENYDNDKGDYEVIWDGSNQKNDRILPDGTYFYVIDCNIERLCSVTGWVQIMR